MLKEVIDEEVAAIHDAFPWLYGGDTRGFLESVRENTGDFRFNPVTVSADEQTFSGSQLDIEYDEPQSNVIGQKVSERHLSFRVGRMKIAAVIHGELSARDEETAQGRITKIEVTPRLNSLRIEFPDQTSIDLYNNLRFFRTEEAALKFVAQVVSRVNQLNTDPDRSRESYEQELAMLEVKLRSDLKK